MFTIFRKPGKLIIKLQTLRPKTQREREVFFTPLERFARFLDKTNYLGKWGQR